MNEHVLTLLIMLGVIVYLVVGLVVLLFPRWMPEEFPCERTLFVPVLIFLSWPIVALYYRIKYELKS